MEKIKEDNYLLYIPKRKHLNWEYRDNGVYLIFYHNRLIEKFIRWLSRKPIVSDLELDKVGSKVWSYMDGKSTVYEISEKLKIDFGKDFDPDYKRLIMFLNYINKKGWISFDKKPQN